MTTTWSDGYAVGAEGLRLHFYDSGGAGLPVLLMLHALLANSGGLQPAALYFTDSFRVILPDARGHGGSDLYIPGSFTMENMLTDTLAIIRQESPSSPVVLFGAGMGASVAARVAEAYPELVSALVLESPPWGAFTDSLCTAMAAPATERLLQALRQLRAMTTEELEAMAESKQLSPLQMGSIEAQLGFNLPACEPSMGATMIDDCVAVVGLLPPSRLQLGAEAAADKKLGTKLTMDMALRTVATWRHGSLKVFANGSNVLHVPPTETEWAEDVRLFLAQHVPGSAVA